MWLCPLPSRRLKPTLQLASHSHCSSLSLSSPHATQTNRQVGCMEQGGERRSGGESEEEQNDETSQPAVCQSPGPPLTLVTVRGWGISAVIVTGDVWADLCSCCSKWDQDFASGAALHDTAPHSPAPASCTSQISLSVKSWGGWRVKKIKKNQPFSSVAITITTSTSVTAAQVRRFCCFLAPPFGGCKLCSTPVRPQTF